MNFLEVESILTGSQNSSKVDSWMFGTSVVNSEN